MPMIFSSLAIVFIYKTGNKFINRNAALVSSLLYTFSNIVIMEAHDARVYSLLVLLTTASIYFYFSMIDSEKNRRYMTALTVINSLLIYSHFLGFFVILSQVIFTLAIPEARKKLFKKYLISSILVFLFYTPYLYFVILRFSQAFQSGIYTPNTEIIHLINLSGVFGNNLLISIQFVLILLIFGFYSLINHLKLSIYEKIIITWPFLVTLIVAIVSLKISIIAIPRYLIFITPGFFLALSVSFKYITENSKIAGIFLMLFSISLMAFTADLRSSQGFEIKNAVTVIQEYKSDSTIVYIVPNYTDIVFTYHYNINAFRDFGNYEEYLKRDNIYVLDKPDDIKKTAIEGASDMLLLVGWHPLVFYDPNNEITNMLNTKFKNSELLKSFNGYEIYRFWP
jgi:uncharacterized membrane protein